MSETTLYKIADEFSRLDELLENAPNENLAEYFEQEQNDVAELLTKKIDSCVGYYQREEDLIELAKKRISELQAYVKTKTRKLENFENYVFFCMNKIGKEKLDGELTSVKFRKPAKSVNIFDEKSIPAKYLVVKTESYVDKKAISSDLKSGEDVPGANLVDGKTSLIFGLKK